MRGSRSCSSKRSGRRSTRRRAMAERRSGETTMTLEGDRLIVITRTFRGPARIVFEAWTRADLVARWWAPKSLGVEVVKIEADVRVGGRYRYVLRNRTGEEIAF